jgi:hypothetical protein
MPRAANTLRAFAALLVAVTSAQASDTHEAAFAPFAGTKCVPRGHGNPVIVREPRSEGLVGQEVNALADIGQIVFPSTAVRQ